MNYLESTAALNVICSQLNHRRCLAKACRDWLDEKDALTDTKGPIPIEKLKEQVAKLKQLEATILMFVEQYEREQKGT